MVGALIHRIQNQTVGATKSIVQGFTTCNLHVTSTKHCSNIFPPSEHNTPFDSETRGQDSMDSDSGHGEKKTPVKTGIPSFAVDVLRLRIVYPLLFSADLNQLQNYSDRDCADVSLFHKYKVYDDEWLMNTDGWMDDV